MCIPLTAAALRSATLALWGVLGAALLALPLSFFVYRVVLGLPRVGALHALALFLAAALAADDVCVVRAELVSVRV